MNMLIVVGGGGHAKVVISAIQKSENFTIAGYVDPDDHGEVLGVPWLGDDAVLDGSVPVAIGVGAISISDYREQLFLRLRKTGCPMPAVVSPDAIVNREVAVGDATVVLDGAVVNSGSCIGRGCIINTRAVIEHDCRIQDFAHVAPGAVVCGGSTVGRGSLIGAGATVIQGVSIGAGCLVGAGSVVRTSVSEPGIYVGNPLRKLDE